MQYPGAWGGVAGPSVVHEPLYIDAAVSWHIDEQHDDPQYVSGDRPINGLFVAHLLPAVTPHHCAENAVCVGTMDALKNCLHRIFDPLGVI